MALQRACAGSVLLLSLFAGVNAVQLPKPSTPKSQNDNAFYAAANGTLAGPPRNTYGTADLPEDSDFFKAPASVNTPDQVKLMLVSPTEVWVTFTTYKSQNGTYTSSADLPSGPQTPSVVPVVQYGLTSDTYSTSVDGTVGNTYTQTANNGSSSKVYYISPYLWTAKLKNLQPSTRYFYVVSNQDAAPSSSKTKEFSFKTQAPVGDHAPITIGVMGDIGETYNTTDTLAHMMGNNPDLVYYMADFSYADHYLNNNPVKWDLWGRLLQPLLANTPFATTNGNHEIESGNGNNQGTTFQSYQNRYPVPYADSNSSSFFYYSVSHGSVHALFISEYTDYSKGSAQYQWAAADLAAVNRTATPWIIVVFHGPVYHTYTTHYKQYDCFRQVWEPLFNSAGVDIIMSGHVHAYERSNPVNNYTADATGCAPTYFTIGDGGNSEQLYHAFVNGNATDGTSSGTDGCPTPSANDLSADPATCVSPVTQVPYCTTDQPEWSSYREDAFGHGILKIYNGSVAEWFWYRNLDQLPMVTDSVVFQRDTSACPNRRQGAVLAPLDNVPPPPVATPPPATKAPTAAPTTSAPSPATSCPSGEYLKGGHCDKCVTSSSPFKTTRGGYACYPPATADSKSTSCKSAALSVLIRADDVTKTKTCIGRTNPRVTVLLPLKSATYSFLQASSYKSASIRLNNGSVAARKDSHGDVIVSTVTIQGVKRRQVQFDVGGSFRNRASGTEISISGVLQRGQDLLPYCWADTIPLC